VANMVLAELTTGITEALEQSTYRRVQLVHTHRRAREADLRQPAADDVLAGKKCRTPCRATLLAIIMQKSKTFPAQTINLGCRVTHQAVAVCADIGHTDVIAEDDEDVWLFIRRHCGSACKHRHQNDGYEPRNTERNFICSHKPSYPNLRNSYRR